jgi:S-adenosylmethionine:tRNA ribosyltransferase-isomerase
LLYARHGGDRFFALTKPARKLRPGDTLLLGRTLKAEVLWRGEAGQTELGFRLFGSALDAAIAEEGEVPLPPYIAKRRPVDAQDTDDYQTIFARKPGSVAAPTAGLHFTPELLAALKVRGVTQESVTLHVGLGTFLPVTASDTTAHKMYAERTILTAETAARLNQTRAAGGRIVAVGTTSLRTLETAARADGTLEAFEGDTDLFITPGYRFKTAEVLLTNFHLPRSTLFMLVCAFCGIETIKAAYAEAIRERYRFYSYGDACLLFRRPS